jgi:biopolymer transport protein TolQ
MQFSAVSIFNLILHADKLVQLVMAILAFASIWSWAIIFDKIVKFKILRNRTQNFEHEFEEKMIEDVFAMAKKKNNHPLARVFLACMKEWKMNDIKKIASSDSEKKSSLKERLMSAMQVASNKSLQKLEKGLSFLAIIGSVAPFVGLFGTVWGILNSFQGIAVAKNTSLAVVAPGIAEALLATAIGLFAAIPAVFFYNVFSNKINNFSQIVDNFSMQLLNELSRELDK